MESRILNIYLNIDANFLPKAKYVFKTLCQVLGFRAKFFSGLTSEEIHIYYGLRTEDKYPIYIFHNPEAVDFFSRKELYPPHKINLIKYKHEYMPVLFSQKGELFNYTSTSIRIRKDLISSAFYFLSCWQEYASPDEISPSSHYDYFASSQYRFGFTDVPPVDRYCELLGNVIRRTFPEFSVDQIWPNGKKFGLSLSHNVEFWNLTPGASSQQIHHNISKKLLYLFNRNYYDDPTRMIKGVLRRENLLKASSSFFLLTKSDFPDKRRNYFDDETYFNQIVKMLKDKSVNLHGSKEAAYQYHFLPEELDKLEGFSANGFRVRYLNFRYQNLFKVLEQAKIKYDSSIGFDERIGYRAGISYPFQPYNMEENRPFNVLEIPLIVLDEALFKQTGSNYKKAMRRMNQLIAIAKKHRSHFSICWHTHMFDLAAHPYLARLYWRTLQNAKLNGAWLCSLDKLYDYWKDR